MRLGLPATPGRAAAVLLLSGLMAVAIGSEFGRVSQAYAAESTPGDQADGSAQLDDQTTSGGNDQTAGQKSQPAAGESEKERLAVNPVTGLAILSAAHYVPLTGKERWKLYWKQNYVSMGAYFGPVLTSLVLDQATNSPKQWGEGLGGYGRRLASRTGGAIIQGTVQATAAAILQEDVRYIPSEREGGARRVLHAIAYSFLTYNRVGHPTVNVPNLSGYFASAAISTRWLPGQRGVARYALTNGSEQIGLGVAVNLLQEFWFEVTNTVKHRQKSPSAAALRPE
jgi:hypothetical protein